MQANMASWAIRKGRADLTRRAQQWTHDMLKPPHGALPCRA